MFGWSDAPSVFQVGNIIKDVLNLIFRCFTLLWSYTPIIYVFVAAALAVIFFVVVSLFRR